MSRWNNSLTSARQVTKILWLPAVVVGLIVLLFALAVVAMQQSTPNVPAFVPQSSGTTTGSNGRELTVTNGSSGSVTVSDTAPATPKQTPEPNTSTTNRHAPSLSATTPQNPTNTEEMSGTINSTPTVGGRGADTPNDSEPIIVEPASPSSSPDSSSEDTLTPVSDESGPDASVDTPVTDPITLDVEVDDGVQVELGL